MPAGTVIAGSSYKIKVGTTNPPTIDVGGVKSWDYPFEAPTSKDDFYNFPSVITPGKKSGTMTLTCVNLTGDSGQQALYAAWTTQNTIYVQVLQDTTNGETLPVKVTNRSISGPDVNNPSQVVFTLGQQADPIVVGGGFGA